jgi:hypothetical protein
MTWKSFWQLVLFIAAIQLVGVLLDDSARWLALAGLLAVASFASIWRRRRFLAQLRRLGSLDPAERDAELAAMDSDDCSAFRFALGLVRSEDANADVGIGESFSYRQTPRIIWQGTFWGSIATSAGAASALAFDRIGNPSEIPYAVGLAIGFFINAVATRVYWEREGSTIRINQSGLVHLSHNGARTGILWSEVSTIRMRRFRRVMEVRGPGRGQLIRIGFALDRFGRLLELLEAYLQEAQDRAA